MSNNPMPNTDIIDNEFLEAATKKPGPWITISMPTVRAGRETQGLSTQYENLLKLAEDRLREMGHDNIDELLAEARSLGTEHDFWQNQGESLVVFAAPGYTRHFRLSFALADEVSVGDAPRLHPLAVLLSESGVFHVLQLSQNSVRLFEATRASIGELDLEETPSSLDEVQGESEPQLQHSPQSAGGEHANFHGHADEGSNDLDRFFREVAAGVDEVLGRSVPHPLVLAAVAEHHSAFAPLTRQQVLDEVVAGNHDHTTAAELHAAALPIAERAAKANYAELLDRFGALVGTGKASEQLQSIQRAAEEGRVDTLIVAPEPTTADGQPDIVDDPVDKIIVDVLKNSGKIVVIDDGEAKVRAVYRY